MNNFYFDEFIIILIIHQFEQARACSKSIRINSKHLKFASPVNFMNSRNCFDFESATKSKLFGYVLLSYMLIGIFYIYSQRFQTFLIICAYDNFASSVATKIVHERF